MDETYLLVAARYVEMNPVKAGLTERPEDSELLHKHERTGRPLGQETFVDTLETGMNRLLRPQKRGPKKAGER